MSLIPLQVQLEAALGSFTQVASIMQMKWAWPLVESAHFIGLMFLIGSIAAWDLRLVGMFKEVPAAAFHRLVPFAVMGFAINAVTGLLFLITYPDQYVYNSAFHLKLLCILLAGVNVAAFYLTMFRRVTALGPDMHPPALARASGALSLILWLTVIVCGRMITFLRPPLCGPGEAVGFIVGCVAR